MSKKNSLNRIDWIRAGFRALSHEGAKGIRVEALARTLKISKGSFYWHFNDVSDLKQQMLDHWYEAASQTPIAAVMAQSDDAEARLRAVVAYSAGNAAEAYGGIAVEGAIREWARFDPNAQRVMHIVESERIEFVTRCFIDLGFEHKAAQRRAELLLAGLIGFEHLAQQHALDIVVHMDDLLSRLLPQTK